MALLTALHDDCAVLRSSCSIGPIERNPWPFYIFSNGLACWIQAGNPIIWSSEEVVNPLMCTEAPLQKLIVVCSPPRLLRRYVVIHLPNRIDWRKTVTNMTFIPQRLPRGPDDSIHHMFPSISSCRFQKDGQLLQHLHPPLSKPPMPRSAEF